MTTNIQSGLMFTERDGHELAVAMLREIESMGDACAIEAEYRAGAPQENVVLRYLGTIRERRSEQLEAGFCALVTEMLYSMANGTLPSADFYEGLMRDGRI